MKYDESNVVELKSKVEDSLIYEIIAFLNSYLGGTIYVGIDDDGSIIELCQKDEEKKPIVDTSLIGFKIIFSNKNYDVFRKMKDPWLTGVTEKVTEKEVEILDLLTMNPEYTLPQMSQKLMVSRKTIASRIKSLKEKGIVERIGSDKKGYWKIHK